MVYAILSRKSNESHRYFKTHLLDICLSFFHEQLRNVVQSYTKGASDTTQRKA